MRLIIFISVLSACVAFDAKAQSDSVYSDKCEWYVPTLAEVQFAGNIGFFSAGAGYQYASNKMELHLMYGYVPEIYGGDLHILTLKSVYVPLKRIVIHDHFSADVLTIGIPISYTFGDQFFVSPPRDQYPKRYYDYSSAIRFGIFAGGKLNYSLKQSCALKEASFYYELGTYDLLLHNYIFNIDHMRFGDLFSLALGVQFRFGRK